ncbi:hypothetical protein [uncultured Marixanthomonas sp.]|uniref:hypothetical protein n=1 Tax=uncultured Marixanthomonas sp. TaxID=757245 RepID=UPI0030D995D7
MISKPYYQITLKAVDCRFSLTVNDQFVFQMNVEDGQISTQIPINHTIVNSGYTDISVSVNPQFGQKKFADTSEFVYECHLYDIKNGFTHIESFGENRTPDFSEKERPLNAFAHTQKLEVTVPYQLNDAWKSGKDLKEIDDFEEKLRGAYREVGQIIKNKQFEVLRERLSRREENIAKAMYLSPVDSRARLNGLINDFEDGFTEMELPQQAMVIYSAKDRKASLRRLTGEPALSFNKKEPFEQLFLDLEFYWPVESNKMEVI